MLENSITEFKGLKEDDNPIMVKSGSALSVYARILESLRPHGGMLSKVRGNSKHSTLNYKMADRPNTLIRYVQQDGTTKKFLALAWDNILNYAGGAWVPLLSPGSVAYSSWYLIPSNLLYGAALGNLHYSYTNRVFDHLIYKDILYLTDGYNRPIKYDGTSVGSWGYRQFSNATEALASVEQNAAGNLADVTVNYSVSLYDSTRSLEGNASTTANRLEYNPSGATKKVWVYVNPLTWSIVNNYDYENEFADQIRIYRAPADGVSGTDRHLAATLTKGVISYTDAEGAGTVALNGATGLVTGIGTDFDGDGITVGDAFYMIGKSTVYQVSVAPVNDTELTVVASDGQATTSPADDIIAGQYYWVTAGFIDNTNDITGNTLYHGDHATAPEDHTVPKNCRYCIMFGESNVRAFIAGDPDEPNRLYYSMEDQPDYFPIANYVDIDPDDGDRITALIKFQGQLYIFKRLSTAVMNVKGHPYEWNFTARVLSVGTLDKECLTDCDGVLVFVNLAGIWAWDGRRLSRISHSEKGSNVIGRWSKVVQSKIATDTRVVYHEARNEAWISLTLDDERGLYDGSLGDHGSILESSTKVADDGGGGHPQANGTLVYRLDTGQWFFIPHLGATAWCVWQGQDDENELYRGDYHNIVTLEDNTESMNEVDGDSGQATSGGASTLTDSAAAWTTNEWATGTIYVHYYDGATPESATITSNTGTEITRSGTWTQNPASSDYYVIVLDDATQNIRIRWRTPMLVIDSVRLLKWLLELMVRIFGTGTVTISWTMDGGEGAGGSFQVTPSQGDTSWGNNKWARRTGDATSSTNDTLTDSGESWTVNAYAGDIVWVEHADDTTETATIASNTADTLTISGTWTSNPASGDHFIIYDSDTMIWSDIDEIISELNFPENAEGKFIELEIMLRTASKFELTALSLGYKIHTGLKWAP
ncbi:hypothetical protein LCGC14_0412370 [marine sediment metagenome]|uniref:Uncharacterized protein n=1 Tax=marine sediment metagenome TaxID=412755 RepID=A0A0F9VFF4_9ZZZZ